MRNYRRTRPYEFLGVGAMDVTKQYKLIWFGDIHGPKPYKSIGSLARRSFRTHQHLGLDLGDPVASAQIGTTSHAPIWILGG